MRINYKYLEKFQLMMKLKSYLNLFLYIMNNKTNGSFSEIKKSIINCSSKKSDPGVIGQKLIDRAYQLDIRRPVLGEKLPNSMEEHDLAVIFGGPMSINEYKFKIYQTRNKLD